MSENNKKETAEGGQDLRRLKRTVSILGASVILLAISFCVLALEYTKTIGILNLMTENIGLLSLRLDLLVEVNDDVAQIVGDILEMLRLLSF